MHASSLHCHDDRRRGLVWDSPFFGLDYLEVSPDQLTLTVYFLGRAPRDLKPDNLQIEGGERITDIQVVGIELQPADDPALDDVMLVRVDQSGDFSTYRLCVRALDEQGHPTRVALARFDPRYACLEFSFKAGCPSDLDCKAPPICPPPERSEPDINYLAKDYASFRQLIFDRLAVIMPDWKERHAPDIGVALVELLAYIGDQLSYYQDAVATEAYLDTARERISVRRHARLVDYLMHEGCNARAWVCLQVGSDFPLEPAKVSFLAGLDQNPALAAKSLLTSEDLKAISTSQYEVFEPLVGNAAPIRLRAAHNEILIYTWGERLCCLPVGTTQAVLLDSWTAAPTPTPAPAADRERSAAAVAQPAASTAKRKLALRAGDVIIFEEVKGPVTGNPADADRSRRWAVRLTRVTPLIDELIKTAEGRPTPLVEIEWDREDALPFPLCLSARLPAPLCTLVDDISVVRGNVILVDHGRKVSPSEDLGTVEKTTETGECACEGSVIEITNVPATFRPKLAGKPLTFKTPPRFGGPASQALAQDPRAALPAITLNGIPAAPDGTASLFTADDLENPTALAGRLRARSSTAAQFLHSRLSSQSKTALAQWKTESRPPDSLLKALAEDIARLLELWVPRRDLLASNASDRHFVVEMNDDGIAHLRFGDGLCGSQPGAGLAFLASYRLGNGVAGNVSAEQINRILFHSTAVDGVSVVVRNPLPAQGGIEPEPVAEVKLYAPGAFRKHLDRAVTATDYATLAERNPRLQKASALLRWTGSWYEAAVAVDPRDSNVADEAALRHVRGHLHPYRRVGHDLAVSAADYVPLELGLHVCVQPHFLRAHVEAALLDVFSNRILAGGRRGFFHPDNLTFGEGVYLSRLVAAAQAVAGVRSVEVKTFQRLFDPPGDELAAGVLVLRPTEIPRLDNDPNFPEHGKINLTLGGGR